MAKRSIDFQLKINTKKGTASIKKIKGGVKDFSQSASKDVDKVSKSFKGMGKAAKSALTALTAVGVAYLYLMKKCVVAASNLQETQSKFDVIFKDTAKQAESMAKVLVDSYAMSRRESKEYLANIQDLLVPMGMVSKEAIIMSNEIVKLSADLSSFNNIPTADVINNVQGALIGNYETMKKYGVILNETIIKQKAYEMGLYNGEGAIKASTKAQASFKLMLEASAAALGDQERTMGSYANQIKQLKANYEDISVAIGEKLLPEITEWVSQINESIKQNPQILEDLAEFSKTILDIATAMGKVIGLGVKFVNTWTKTWQAMGLAKSGIITWSQAINDGVTVMDKFNEGLSIDAVRLLELERVMARTKDRPGVYTQKAYEDAKKAHAALKALIESRKTLTVLPEIVVTGSRIPPPDAPLPDALDYTKEFELFNQQIVAMSHGVQKFSEDKVLAEREAAKQIENIRKDFYEQYNAIGKTELELGMERIQKEVEMYEKAGISKIRIKEWEIDQIRKLEIDLHQYQETSWDRMEQAMDSWAMSFGNTMNDVLWGAETTFEEIAKSFGKMITQMLIQEAMLSLTSGFGGLFGGGGGPTVQSDFAKMGIAVNAQGNAFNNGKMMAYAKGGVVSQPTIFPMANGAGLMGEAGPEAILPLSRTAGGDLGIKSEGGGGTTNIVINAVDSQSFAEAIERNPGSIVSVINSALEENTGLRSTVRNTL